MRLSVSSAARRLLSRRVFASSVHLPDSEVPCVGDLVEGEEPPQPRAWELPTSAGGIGRRLLNFDEVEERRMADDGGQLWVHIDPTSSVHREWVLTRSGLPADAAALLTSHGALDATTRAGLFRSLEGSPAILLTLRGVRRLPGTSKNDYISLRLWCEEGMLISARMRSLKYDESARTKSCFDAATLPRRAEDVLTTMVADLVKSCTEVVKRERDSMVVLETRITELEANPPWFFSLALAEYRRQLATARLRVTEVKRYLKDTTPELDCLVALAASEDPRQRSLVAVSTSSAIRMECGGLASVDRELRSLVSRGHLLHEEAAVCVMEQLNKSMYVIALITAVCLPLAAAANATFLWREYGGWICGTTADATKKGCSKCGCAERACGA